MSCKLSEEEVRDLSTARAEREFFGAGFERLTAVQTVADSLATAVAYRRPYHVTVGRHGERYPLSNYLLVTQGEYRNSCACARADTAAADSADPVPLPKPSFRTAS